MAGQNDNTAAAQSFNNAANQNKFISAKVTSLDTADVDNSKSSFTSRINETVMTAASNINLIPDESILSAAHEYALAVSLNRGKVSPQEIAALLQKGANDIREETRYLLSPFTELERKIKKFDSEGSLIAAFKMASRKFFKPRKMAGATLNTPDDLPWDEHGRIYMRLEDSSQSPVQALIEEKLTARGFTVTDYAAGRAVDGRKNEWKIGKILKDEPALLQAYSDDPSRRSQKLMVVLTRNVTDIARASYNRGWQSCRTGADAAASRGVAEARAGVIMAYLVSERDPEIHNPYSRISLKPYDRVVENKHLPEWSLPVTRSCTMYAAFNPIGLHHPGFAAAMNEFVEETFNRDKVGRFKLRDDCESYRELKERTRLPDDIIAALDYLEADYQVNSDGTIKVKGKLKMSGLGLTNLPDMSRLDLSECHLDISRNRLLTLEGLPEGHAIKSLDASQNLLVCFASSNVEISGEFNYRNNFWLMTTYGAPKAASYLYGNGHSDYAGLYKDSACIGPLEKPQAFPGFKRK